MKFERENRYIVLKIKDVAKLPIAWQTHLVKVEGMVDGVRRQRGRDPLECVVVESDWRIYEHVWLQVELEHQVNNPEPVATKVEDPAVAYGLHGMLRGYLLDHEFDICIGENDFADLRETFIYEFGREPSTDRDKYSLTIEQANELNRLPKAERDVYLLAHGVKL